MLDNLSDAEVRETVAKIILVSEDKALAFWRQLMPKAKGQDAMSELTTVMRQHAQENGWSRLLAAMDVQ